MFKRRTGIFYLQNNETKEQFSLKTRNKDEADELLKIKNDGRRNARLNLELGRAYLRNVDPEMEERTWATAISLLCQRGEETTRARAKREFDGKPYDLIRSKRIVETTPELLKAVLKKGGSATNHYLRRLHNLAVDNGFLFGAIIPAKQWEKPLKKPKRAITREEHSRIIAVEQNQERKNYYQMLWLTGAAQTDGALLKAENIDYGKQALIYRRKKTGQWCKLGLSSALKTLLRQLPEKGFLFPYMASLNDKDRSAEFARRRRQLNLKGITLHSYRYSWAQSAFEAGYSERHAQAALGHASRAVHHAYARNADFVCPALEAIPLLSDCRIEGESTPNNLPITANLVSSLV